MSPQAGRHPARPFAVTDWRHRSRSPPRLAPYGAEESRHLWARSPRACAAAARRARILSAFSPPSSIGTPVSDAGGDRRSSSTACNAARRRRRQISKTSIMVVEITPACRTDHQAGPGGDPPRRNQNRAHGKSANPQRRDTRRSARTIPAPDVTVSAVRSRSSSERRAPSGTTSSPGHMRSSCCADLGELARR